jgi:sugar-specific transcriptional regulator TrmB
MDEHLLKLLEQANFTEKEAQVYLALLELGKGTVTDIAKITELKRSIIYVILEGLIKRGFASTIPGKKINIYQAGDASLILNQLSVLTKNFSEMLPVFNTLSKKGKRKPKITYHESREGILKVYEESSHAKESFYITSYVRMNRFLPGAFQNWLKGLKKGIYKFKSLNLVPENEEEIRLAKEMIKEGQKARTLSELNDMRMDFALFDNKLAITSLEEEPFIVEIESEEIVKSMKPIFDIAWQKGKQIKI